MNIRHIYAMWVKHVSHLFRTKNCTVNLKPDFFSLSFSLSLSLSSTDPANPDLAKSRRDHVFFTVNPETLCLREETALETYRAVYNYGSWVLNSIPLT